MKKAAVIGSPISHSLSPKIHNFFLKKYEIEGSYDAIEVKKDDLKTSVESFVNQEFSGFNVTLPLKEEIFKICDHKSKTASLTKAVNTVIITKDKKIFGHNSDADGFLTNLKQEQQDFDLKNKNAFVFGAGGAARAIVYSLIKSKMSKITITNRSENRAIDLIKDFEDFAKDNNCEIEFLNQVEFENNLNNCDLLVNSTSLGMVLQDPLIINLQNLNKSAIIYDIVYKPLMTDLLKEGQKRGNKIVTGIGMLVFQALVGFEAWYGEKPEIDQKLVELLTS